MTVTIEEITQLALPWKPGPPKADPELVEKLESYFTADGDLTDVGLTAGVGPGIFVAAMPTPPRRKSA